MDESIVFDQIGEKLNIGDKVIHSLTNSTIEGLSLIIGEIIHISEIKIRFDFDKIQYNTIYINIKRFSPLVRLEKKVEGYILDIKSDNMLFHCINILKINDERIFETLMRLKLMGI